MAKIYVYANPMSRRRPKRLKNAGFCCFSIFTLSFFFKNLSRRNTCRKLFHHLTFASEGVQTNRTSTVFLKYRDAQTRENQNPRQGSHQPTTRMHRAQGGTRGQIASRGKTEGSTRSCSHFLFSWRTNKVISAR